MKQKIQINNKISYLIIAFLTIVIFYLLKLLLQYPFFSNIRTAILNIIIPFSISFVVVYVFHPILYWVEKELTIKTWVSTLILLLINIILVIVLIDLFFPILATQISDLFKELPGYLKRLDEFIDKLPEKYEIFSNKQIYNTLKHVLNIISAKTGETIINSMISGIMFTLKSFWIIIFIPILIFMMMKDYSLFYNKLSKFLIKHKRSEWIQLLKNIDKKLGAYIRGQIIVMAYMFVGTLIFLLILGMPNALVFAIIVAFTNIIPYIGPYIGGFPLWIYALFQSPYLFVGSIIVIFIMQQLDGNIGQPIVFGTQLKIHPLMILAIMLTGLSLNGIIGLLISIPVYIILSETFIFFKPKLKELHNKKPISE